MDPAFSSAVWKSIHTTINKIKDWYSVINIEKLLLPKLYCVLQNGRQYCAKSTNHYETPAVTMSFVECLGYIFLNINNQNALLRKSC
ncbi:hypothetical protein E2986_13401 [Frieseomelitta varia]|uniref:Uncharacterized protein n=1 Tax=Frieseomelitta varia TaxID=561572 RepID=A0A833RU18_9HYME|nr:hypothetical protein E2986_13401 [Frieseomelitta varia]